MNKLMRGLVLFVHNESVSCSKCAARRCDTVPFHTDNATFILLFATNSRAIASKLCAKLTFLIKKLRAAVVNVYLWLTECLYKQ